MKRASTIAVAIATASALTLAPAALADEAGNPARGNLSSKPDFLIAIENADEEGEPADDFDTLSTAVAKQIKGALPEQVAASVPEPAIKMIADAIASVPFALADGYTALQATLPFLPAPPKN